MKNLLLIALVLVTILADTCPADEIAGKFAPPAGKVLVFAGQDNASVGGTAKYHDGYVDKVGVPGGITHYVYFSEGWTNAFGRTFAQGSVAGLNSETEWASGPMHQKAYLDSPILDRCVMHVSIAMEGNCEDKVADGSFDHLIAEFVKFVGDHPEHPFLIRIGYEFDGSWNKYDPENFKKAFRRIVDALRAEKLSNFATVFASSSSVTPGQFEEYDPGADYYEWVGYSWWGGDKDGLPAIEFARKVGKPVFIAEATPRGHFFGKEKPAEVWDTWFKKFFDHIEQNKDVIRAVSYINADWDSQDMWDGWGQTRIETSPLIKERWLEKMADPMFINAADNPFEHIGFPAAKAEPASKVLPYKDASLSVKQRVDDLLGRMTIDEKVAQITGWWDYREKQLLEQGEIFTPEFYAGNCPNGIGELGPLHNLTIDEDAKQYAAIQNYFRNQTRLGIPAIVHDEAAHGFMRFEANSFPAPIGLSCSWNPDLLAELYSQAGQEARSRGISHILSPIVDVARDLRWGRVDETLGEDPFLVSRLGAAMVRGLQGSADGTVAPTHVAATLKHFVGYAGTEGGRNRSPYSHSPRHLLDTEVEPFRYVIQTAKPSSVMAAFNEVDGLPCHVNPWILTQVLRDDIGFEGLVVGDYQGIDLVRQYQKIGTSDADAGRMALEAGLQLELPNNFGFKHLPKLVQDGKVSTAKMDAAVRAVLELKFRLGLFESPAELDVAKAKSLASSAKATELAREAARQSIVLLKNENSLLPLTAGGHQTIAVIGPNADVCRLGNYSGRPQKTVSLLEGIRTHVGNSAKVTHAEGCKIAHNDAKDSYANWRYVNEIEFATLEDNRLLIEDAVKLAKEADLVVLALGENVLLAREAWGGDHIGDRTTFDLTESQQALADAVLATGKPVVLFLNNSKPVTLHALGDRIPAIITAHYSGQETGTAAAEIIFGETNPSGKLTLSWPRSVGHLPSHYSQNGSAQVFDYVDSPRAAVYPFGYGLSYTTFSYGNAALSAAEIRAGESVSVSFDITNTGQRAGTEIAQLYVSGESFAIARPMLELKGFARVTLQPGETRKVTIELDANDLHFHDTALRRVLPSGKYLVRVGRSSSKLGNPVTLVTKATAVSESTAVSRVPHTRLEELVPRHYYGAKLEPKAHVLHGAGQCGSQDVVDYAKTLGSYDPAIFMDYCGVKDAGADFANNLKKKLDEFPKYTVVQLGLGMTQDGKPEEHYEHEVAAGKYDANLSELFEGLKALDVPFFIRIGYECNGSWNGYQPEAYKIAFRHVTEMIRESGLNAATVWCTIPHASHGESDFLPYSMGYYPGDEWVDWWAMSLFALDQIENSKALLREAHAHRKPMMIGESTPQKIGVLDGQKSWDKWFVPYFKLIHDHPEIKAFCYINWNWGAYPQWKDWGDARLQQNEVVADLYRREMSLPLYQHASTKQAFHSSQLATGEPKALNKTDAGDCK